MSRLGLGHDQANRWQTPTRRRRDRRIACRKHGIIDPRPMLLHVLVFTTRDYFCGAKKDSGWWHVGGGRRHAAATEATRDGRPCLAPLTPGTDLCSRHSTRPRCPPCCLHPPTWSQKLLIAVVRLSWRLGRSRPIRHAAFSHNCPSYLAVFCPLPPFTPLSIQACRPALRRLWVDNR